MTTFSASALFLVFEAATSAGSVAIIRVGIAGNGEVLAASDVAMGVGRDDHLFPAASAVLASVGVLGRDLAGIVCGSGPGSFTSLRIAASLAKGLASGYEVPLYAVSSLLLAAAAVPDDLVAALHNRHLVIHADALRGERYVQAVLRSADGRIAAAGSVSRVATEALDTVAAGGVLIGVRGSASAADPPNASSIATMVTPRAAALVRVAPDAWHTPVSLDAWEPEYGRLAEAQVQWEVAHQRALPTGGEPREDSPS